MNIRILSIDAWRDSDGWTWNNWSDKPIGARQMKLTDKQIWTAITALRAAAVQYITDAHRYKDVPNVFERFTARAREADALADYLEANSD